MPVFAVICLHSKPIKLAKIAKDPKKLIRGVFSSIATELPYCATKQQKEHDCFQEQDLPLSTASHLFSHHEINRRAFPPYEKSLKFSQRKKFWRGEKKNFKRWNCSHTSVAQILQPAAMLYRYTVLVHVQVRMRFDETQAAVSC